MSLNYNLLCSFILNIQSGQFPCKTRQHLAHSHLRLILAKKCPRTTCPLAKSCQSNCCILDQHAIYSNWRYLLKRLRYEL